MDDQEQRQTSPSDVVHMLQRSANSEDLSTESCPDNLAADVPPTSHLHVV